MSVSSRLALPFSLSVKAQRTRWVYTKAWHSSFSAVGLILTMSRGKANGVPRKQSLTRFAGAERSHGWLPNNHSDLFWWLDCISRHCVLDSDLYFVERPLVPQLQQWVLPSYFLHSCQPREWTGLAWSCFIVCSVTRQESWVTSALYNFTLVD